jgi:hypothetical protein
MDRCKYFFRSKANHSAIDVGRGGLFLKIGNQSLSWVGGYKKETAKRNTFV